MEPLSTIHSGASLVQQSGTFPLTDLAAKARKLVGSQSNPKGIQFHELQLKSLDPKASTSGKNREKEMMEVARKFEGILIHQMLKEMRKTIHKSDLMNSFSLQQYESMMDEEIAAEMAKNKGIGLADSIFNQLSRLDKATQSPVTAPIKFPEVYKNE